MQKHEFALYCDQLSFLLARKNIGDQIPFTDSEIVHRITKVLRLEQHETVIIFDQKIHAQVELVVFSKKNVEAIVLNKANNKVLKPSITVLLPILKRDAFEQAIYSCVELGANQIQLVDMQKAQRIFDEKKEMQRLHTIMIAAAEQSKQFSLPVVIKPKALAQILQEWENDSIVCCDINGQSMLEVLQALKNKNVEKLALLIGPEGDFVDEERALLRSNNVQLCALTPTVLRAQQALVVALGALRATIE